MSIHTKVGYELAKGELDNLLKTKENLIGQLETIKLWITEVEEKLKWYELNEGRVDVTF